VSFLAHRSKDLDEIKSRMTRLSSDVSEQDKIMKDAQSKLEKCRGLTTAVERITEYERDIGDLERSLRALVEELQETELFAADKMSSAYESERLVQDKQDEVTRLEGELMQLENDLAVSRKKKEDKANSLIKQKERKLKAEKALTDVRCFSSYRIG
jgi:predicted  nucleic acid-binding Zn-ribbon protein